LLPILKNDSVASQRKHQKGFFNPRDLSEITPIGRSRVTVSGLHRDGLGLSVIGRIAQSGVTDPNAPGSGFVGLQLYSWPFAELAVPSSSRPVPAECASPLDYRRSRAGQQLKQFRWRRVLFELALGFRGVGTHDSDRARRIRASKSDRRNCPDSEIESTGGITWGSAAWGTVTTFVNAVTPEPVYIDYFVNVMYEGETVYVDNQPIPARQYTQPMLELAVNVEQPPPAMPPPVAPSPATTGQPQAQPAAQPAKEWLSLGVFASRRKRRVIPLCFSRSRWTARASSAAPTKSTLTDDQRAIAGQIDRASLTQDVSPLAIHFGKTRTQTWLLVRMPEPSPAGEPQKFPEAPKAPPPLKTAKAK
jgi:hypothetical protein